MIVKKITLKNEEFARNNRRSFFVAGFASLCAAFGLYSVFVSEQEDGIQSPLRKGFLLNENFWKRFVKSERQNSIVNSPPTGTKARINGDIGLENDIDIEDWNLVYESPFVKKTLTLKDLELIKRTSSQAEFRCIEGWSMPIGYEGVKFYDFLQTIDPQGMSLPYVGLETPEANYYVGIDMQSMLHPQTILADKMNGAALGKEHGEPLRLIIPVKYGIKSLKRVGKIFLTDVRPRDYWAENGYDWYSGH